MAVKTNVLEYGGGNYISAPLLGENYEAGPKQESKSWARSTDLQQQRRLATVEHSVNKATINTTRASVKTIIMCVYIIIYNIEPS